MLLDTTVESADARGVVLVGGQRIETTTVIWAAGVKANHLAHSLGVEVDRLGRVVVGPTLQLPAHPSVFAVGDIAVLLDAERRSAVPMMAPAAIQMGKHAGEQIARLLAGQPPERFRFRNKGIMAVLGRGDAVAEIPLVPWGDKATLRFGGFLAWVLWLGVHIVYLIGFRHRIKVLIDWGWSYFTSRGAGAILLPVPERLPRDEASSVADSAAPPVPRR